MTAAAPPGTSERISFPDGERPRYTGQVTIRGGRVVGLLRYTNGLEAWQCASHIPPVCWCGLRVTWGHRGVNPLCPTHGEDWTHA